MSAQININQAEKLLRDADNILILTHRHPDGDTLGSSFALCRILRGLHKTAHVLCPDPIPEKYNYLHEGIDRPDDAVIRNARFIISVDVADVPLLGRLEHEYGGRVDLCIDHHGSNRLYAKLTLLKPSAAAAGEVIYELWQECFAQDIAGTSDASLTETKIAECLFTAITTDTGCFRYSSVTPKTHEIAACLLRTGIDAAAINRIMFESKSRARMQVEQSALSSLRFFDDGDIAVISLDMKAIAASGADEGDMDGISSIPRKIEGVKAGAFLRETAEGWKLSLRTSPGVDASKICMRLGGGGHPGAAGATVRGTFAEALDAVLSAIRAQ